MKKWFVRIVASIALLLLAAFFQLFFSARPPLTTDPATLAGDGSTIDYCDLPVLDGTGKKAPTSRRATRRDAATATSRSQSSPTAPNR